MLKLKKGGKWFYVKQQCNNGDGDHEEHHAVFVIKRGDDGVIKRAVYQRKNDIGHYQHRKRHGAGEGFIIALEHRILVAQ